MPLKIELKSGDKLIINGAVIENSGPHTKLLVHNKSSILRQKEIMAAEASVTPASRVYFALQCAYIFPQKSDEYINEFDTYIRDYVEASPSSAKVIKKVLDEVQAGRLYQGLKAAQKLLQHENEIMEQAGKTFAVENPT